jgi:hypothetical protein
VGIFDQPLLRLIDHLYELADYFFIRIVKTRKLRFSDILMTKREFQMDLGFCRFTFCIAEFGDKRSLISSFSPRLGDVCTN